jgi:hypothetical protein
MIDGRLTPLDLFILRLVVEREYVDRVSLRQTIRRYFPAFRAAYIDRRIQQLAHHNCIERLPPSAKDHGGEYTAMYRGRRAIEAEDRDHAVDRGAPRLMAGAVR